MTVSETPETGTCTSGSQTGVTSGGTVLLSAQPPAYETVTGFTVTTQSGTSTLAVTGSPAAGQAGTATLTVTGPATVTATTQETPGSCVSLDLASEWLGGTAVDNSLASFTVTGPIGCQVDAATQAQSVNAGDSVQVIPGTPLQIDAHSATISSDAGLDNIVDLTGTPLSAASTGPADASFPVTQTTTVTAMVKMVCVEAPTLVAGTGGTIADPAASRGITGNAAGAIAEMLTPLSTSGPRREIYSPACPAAWGTFPDGVVPGATLDIVATPTVNDASLGFPAGDPRREWGFNSFNEFDQTDDSEATQGASDMTSGGSLAPVLDATKGDGQVHSEDVTEPAANGTSSASVHPVVIGARFERLGCVQVSTDVATLSRDTGGVTVAGAFKGGTAIDASAVPNGGLAIETPSNCPAMGKGYYEPGTQIKVTAADPANLSSYSVATEEQHPGAYDDSTDPTLYTSTPDASSDVASAARATSKKSRKGKRNSKTNPLPSPRHIPSKTPPAARLLPSASKARTAAITTVANHDRTTAAAIAKAAKLAARERQLRQQIERLELHGSSAALRKATRAWGPAVIAWWRARTKVIDDQDAALQAAITAYTKVAQADFAAGGAGVPSLQALQIVTDRAQLAMTQLALTASEQHLAPFDALLRATTRALRRRHTKMLATDQTGLQAMIKVLTPQVSEGKGDVKLDRGQLASATRGESAATRRAVNAIEAVISAGQRSAAAPRKKAAKGASDKRHAVMARAASVPLAHAADSSSRPLYPDEVAYKPGLVKTALVYQGMYADDTDGLLVQSSGDHGATFTVGDAPMTVHATWGPTSCERPSVANDDPAQMSVSVDGGAGACAGPGTVTRFGTFVVDATPTGDAVPVVVVHGLSPNGNEEERVAAGQNESFPALYDTTVEVQSCYPVEFGGALNDTNFGGQSPLNADMIDQFATVVPGTGQECALPGFYTSGTKLQFSLPSPLAQAVDARTITNPYTQSAGNGNDYQYPCDSGHDQYAGCTQVPAAGTQDWEVDGTDVGSSAPTVTVDSSQPQHEVGLDLSVSCDKLTLNVDEWQSQAAGTLSNSDCPVSYPDQGTNSTSEGDNNYQVSTVGYYLPNEVDSLNLPGGGCADYLNGLPPQPESSSDPAPQGNGNWLGIGTGPYYVDFLHGPDWAATEPSAPALGTDSPDQTVTDQSCGGYQSFPQAPDWNIPTLTDLLGDVVNVGESVGEDIYSLASTYIAPVFEQLYDRLDTIFTTDPFSSLSSFEDWAQSVGEVALTAVDPAVGALVLGADYTGALDNPSDFANYLGQVGRFAASTGIELGFTVAQNAGIGAAVQIALSVGDAAIVGLSDALEAAGAPSGLTLAIRSARVVTNGINALKDCTAEAAAGDTPPDVEPAPLSTGVEDDGSALAKYMKAQYSNTNLNEPPPLSGVISRLGQAETLSEGGSILAADLSKGASTSGFGAAMDLVSLAHQLPGANDNWSANDYADCLAAATIG